MQTNVVRGGYDRVAAAYARDRASFGSQKYVTKLIQRLPRGARVLDVGCGDGVPTDKELISKGFQVTGLDISPVQIMRARKNCPRGEFIVADMQTIHPGEYQAEAIVSYYALFHTPRERHGEILKTFSTYLSKGGWLLITMGDVEWEGMTQFHGTPMWWSQYGTKKNRELTERAGFRVVLDEVDASGGERHQVILAQK